MSGNLVKVSPGMGLWLHIDGDQGVEWTRPAVSGSDHTTLTEGWNLVAWTGEDGATPEDAFASLAAELETAASWDADAQEFRRFTTADDAPATP